MNDELFNYIYDAMCLALEQLEESACPVEHPEICKIYEKLDKATGKFYDWYQTAWEHPQKHKK